MQRVSAIKRILFLGCFAVLGFACGSETTDTGPKIPVPQAEMFYMADYSFCGPDGKDQFLLGYHGSNVLDTTISFIIVCEKGDTIWKDVWKAGEMLSASPEALLDDSAKIKFIHHQLKLIIDGRIPPENPEQSHHLLTYIADRGSFENEDNPDLGPGFIYRIGNRPLKYIAWSKSEKRVKEL